LSTIPLQSLAIRATTTISALAELSAAMVVTEDEDLLEVKVPVESVRVFLAKLGTL